MGDSNTQDFNVVSKTRGFDKEDINESIANFVISDLNQSLKLLKRNSLYALLVHHGEDLLRPGGEIIFNKLQILKDRGLVSKIGVSAYIDNQLINIIDRFDIEQHMFDAVLCYNLNKLHKIVANDMPKPKTLIGV